MFPYRDENPRFLTPYVTYGLIVANAAVWVLLQGLGTDPDLSRSVCQLGLMPGELLGTAAPGAGVPISEGARCVVSAEPAYYTLLTSMFTHGSWMHIVGNMWFLWIFGDNVEDSMGHGRFLGFYLLCGLAADGLQIVFAPDSIVPMVGASGAIGGVMGAYVVLYPRVRIHLLVVLGIIITTITLPAIFMLGYWFLLQLAGAALDVGPTGGGVAFWAHIGGFAAGALLIFVFKDQKMVQRHPHRGWRRG